jgi:N-acetylglucosamine-6-sulfatase
VLAVIVLAVSGRGCGGSTPPPASSTVALASRPNIVFILADDMASGLFGADRRFPFLNLPNLDRLADGGIQFPNAFATTSLCSPSRASILSGLYAHSHGVLVNDTIDLPASVTTFPRLLQAAGYRTAFVGKWHMNPNSDAPRPGFDYWVSFKGQGVYDNPVLNVNGVEVARTGYITDILTEYAVEWLRTQGQQPFMLFLSHKAPHGPWEAAPRDAAWPGAPLPEPPSFRDTFRDKPSWQRRYAACGGGPIAFVSCPDPLPSALPPAVWSPREPWRLDYLRTLLALDDSVGSVRSTLDALGVGGSTYVFFLSDNGYMLGEHRLGDKRVAYDPSIRIPFVVGGAGLAAGRPGGMALNIDVAPTILDLAGVAVPPEMQGRSLAGMLRGQGQAVRASFLYEYFPDARIPVVPRILGVRTAQWKLVTYPALAGEEELYDLTADPNEMANLATRSAWAAEKESLRLQMLQLLQETGAGAARDPDFP